MKHKLFGDGFYFKVMAGIFETLMFSLQKRLKAVDMITGSRYIFQTSYFDPTQNLNECERKSEYTEKNLILTIKIYARSRLSHHEEKCSTV